MSTPLIPDPDARFSCSLCGGCCESPWNVLVNAEKMDELRERPWDELGLDPKEIFTKGPAGLTKIRKVPGTTRCILLDDDKLCQIHKAWGEEAKPMMCRRFPYLHVASDEHVWVTANYGCKAVREHSGAPFAASAEHMARVFSKDVGEASPDADTLYPLTATSDLSTPELDAVFDALGAAMGDDIFHALRVLAAFVASAPELSPPEPSRRLDEVPGPVRYAFALSLYADILDPGSILGRLKGVVALPKALAFTLRYQSRLLERPIDMPLVAAHPGQLPPESHAVLIRWLRSRIRGRLIFKGVATGVAGITRLILLVDAMVFYARALAADRAITHDDVLEGIRTVELFIANQQTVTTLSTLDPRLPRFWEDPAVAAGAAQLFTPAPTG